MEETKMRTVGRKMMSRAKKRRIRKRARTKKRNLKVLLIVNLRKLSCAETVQGLTGPFNEAQKKKKQL